MAFGKIHDLEELERDKVSCSRPTNVPQFGKTSRKLSHSELGRKIRV